MLPPSFLSLPCFYSVLSGLSSSPSFSLRLLSSVRSLAHSLIATVSRDFSSFCLMDRTPEPPSPRCRPSSPTIEYTVRIFAGLAGNVAEVKSIGKLRRRMENAYECSRVLLDVVDTRHGIPRSFVIHQTAKARFGEREKEKGRKTNSMMYILHQRSLNGSSCRDDLISCTKLQMNDS